MVKSTDVVVVIPNLNGGEDLLRAVASLRSQTVTPKIIVVDNASRDGSAERAFRTYPKIELIRNKRNRGYAGGVNQGLSRAIALGALYVAPFNDDAVADKRWLEKLIDYLRIHTDHGAVACKVLQSDKTTIDSTGDYLTVWGLPYPRGRGETDRGQYDTPGEIFAASGAASLFRVEALQQVGLFDEDFFAYYEDVDLGFRLRLAGWKIGYEPKAVVYHKIGMTSGKMKGFTTYQTMKNQPLVLWKNLPLRLWPRVVPRFTLAYCLFMARSFQRGNGWYALKGMVHAFILELKKIPERWRIQKTRKLSAQKVWQLLSKDLPPNAHALRRLRARWHMVRGRSS